MKKVLLILGIFCVGAAPAADLETLVGEVETVGFYVTPVLKWGKMNDNTIDAFRADSTSVYFVGGEMGFVVNHRWVVGAAGYVLSSDASKMGIATNDSMKNRFYYGGLLLKYDLSPNSLVHFSVHSLLGFGTFQQERAVPITLSAWGNGNNCRQKNSYEFAYAVTRQSDNFYVVEPGLDLMVNVHSAMRVGLGLSYRYIKGFRSELTQPINLDGFTAQILLKMGEF